MVVPHNIMTIADMAPCNKKIIEEIEMEAKKEINRASKHIAKFNYYG